MYPLFLHYVTFYECCTAERIQKRGYNTIEKNNDNNFITSVTKHIGTDVSNDHIQ